MQAIETKYLPATNTRGSRIKAACERGSITIPYPHELNAEQGHIKAAETLCAKFVVEDLKKYGPNKNPWGRKFVTGGYKNHYFHVESNETKLREALEMAEATLERLAPNGSRATQGTRDVIKAALAL